MTPPKKLKRPLKKNPPQKHRVLPVRKVARVEQPTRVVPIIKAGLPLQVRDLPQARVQQHQLVLQQPRAAVQVLAPRVAAEQVPAVQEPAVPITKVAPELAAPEPAERVVVQEAVQEPVEAEPLRAEAVLLTMKVGPPVQVV